jgi:hypothetical protein
VTGFAATLFLLIFLAFQGAIVAIGIEVSGSDFDRLLVFGSGAAFLLIASGAFAIETPVLSLTFAGASCVIFVLLGLAYTSLFYIFTGAAATVVITMLYETLAIVEEMMQRHHPATE